LRNDLDARIAADPSFDKPFVIVAHSMGGLVARSYMEEHWHVNGQFALLPAGERVSRLITLATPHHGTPSANENLRAPATWQDVLDAIDLAYWKNVTVVDANRRDLRWDNVDGLWDEYDDIPNEQNVWLLNLTNHYDSKISAYFGYSGQSSAWESDILYLSNLNSVPLGVEVAGRKLIQKDDHATARAAGVFLHRITEKNFDTNYNFPDLDNDGVVPINSASFSGHRIANRVECPTHDHWDMRDGTGGLCTNGLSVFESLSWELGLFQVTLPILHVLPSGNIYMSVPQNQAASTQLYVSNIGAGSLSWSLSVQGGASWLVPSISSGVAPNVIDLNVDTAGLLVGSYSSVVTIAAAQGTPVNVTVNLAVVPAVDTTPPETFITSATYDLTSACFTWAGQDNGTQPQALVYSYRLEPIEPTFPAFSSETIKCYYGLSDGFYRFYVKARDYAGNEDDSPAIRVFTVGDTTPPETTITGGTYGPDYVTFTWTGSDNISPPSNLVYSYRLDPVEPTYRAPSSVTSRGYFGLLNGSYTFYVMTQDEAGNIDRTPASIPFTISNSTGPWVERISVDSNGNEADDQSRYPAVSADGRFVAFASSASNLTPVDTHGVENIFWRDRQNGETLLVTVGSDGAPANSPCGFPTMSASGNLIAFVSKGTNLVKENTAGFSNIYVASPAGTLANGLISLGFDGSPADGDSYYPSMSADGRLIVFNSGATNLVSNDMNGVHDIFVYDRQTGETDRVSVSTNGTESNGASYTPVISADGRFVTFYSEATNLAPPVANPNGFQFKEDIFVHDLRTHETTRLVESSGESLWTDGISAISADGRFVAFESGLDNLVPGDTNGHRDVFVQDRQTGQTELVSVASDGTQGNALSHGPAISADGRFIAFTSWAQLVSGTYGGGQTFYHNIYLRDRQTGETTILAYSMQYGGFPLSISADGRFVGFDDVASHLVSGDNNGVSDVFVADTRLVGAPVVVTSELPDATGRTAYSLTLQAIGGTQPYSWVVASGSLPAGLSLDSFTGEISGSPTAGGAFTFQVRVTDSAVPSQSGTRTLSLTVVGGPAVVLSTNAVAFGNQSVGSTSTAQSVTLNNSGTTTLNIANINATGDFDQTNDCGAALPAGQNCTISVTFTPTTPGSRTGELTISSDAAGSPHVVNLLGTGIGPVVNLSVSTLTFANQAVGTTSAAQAVTLTNTGNAVLTIGAIVATSDFTQNHDCGTSVAAAASCNINVTFTPTATGNRTGSLTINSDAPGSPHTVALSGPGTDFTLTVESGGSASATVNAGQSATYLLMVVSSNGFAGNVNLSCSGAPTAATCTVSPAAVNLDGTNPANMTVQVTTTARSLLLPERPQPPPLPQLFLMWVAALLTVAAIIMKLLRLAPARKAAQRLLPAASTAALLLLLISCGGSGGGGTSGPPPPPPQLGTPSGTYTIAVTASTQQGSQVVSRKMNLTLVVQ